MGLEAINGISSKVFKPETNSKEETKTTPKEIKNGKVKIALGLLGLSVAAAAGVAIVNKNCQKSLNEYQKVLGDMMEVNNKLVANLAGLTKVAKDSKQNSIELEGLKKGIDKAQQQIDGILGSIQ